MNNPHAAIAAAAESLVGTPFRLLGRDRQHGLDCVGVLLVVLKAVGCSPRVPRRYTLRRVHIDDFVEAVIASGLASADGQLAAGDLVVLRPAAAQFHAAIIVPDERFVHAHAGLGRVVSSPRPLPWPVEHHWRFPPP